VEQSLGIHRRGQEIPSHSLILAEYGGDGIRGRVNYWEQIRRDIRDGLEVKNKIVGQSVLGTDVFVEWVKKSFANKVANRRELPSLRGILRYKSQDEILNVISKETDKTEKEIFKEKGRPRQMAMEFLFRYGGLKGVEIGPIMGIDYSTVCKERKRLREGLEKDIVLRRQFKRIEDKLSKVKI
jgi:putative transposase